MMMAGSADTNQQLLGQESAPFPPPIFQRLCTIKLSQQSLNIVRCLRKKQKPPKM